LEGAIDADLPSALFQTDHNYVLTRSVVAVADALGTTTSSSSESSAEAFLGRLQAATDRVSLRMNRISDLYHINVRWFSDSIAMSVKFDDTRPLVDLLKNLAYVQAGYALDGIFLRGGVTVGLHCHSNYIDYGPALTEAALLEKAAGATTRIVLSPTLQQNVREYGTKHLPLVEDLADHTYFLNFLAALDRVARAELRSQIEMSYGEAVKSSNIRAQEKLAWLASYFNWRARPPKPIECALNRGFRELP